MKKWHWKEIIKNLLGKKKRFSSLKSIQLFCLEMEFTEEEIDKILSYFKKKTIRTSKISFINFKNYVEEIMHRKMNDERIRRLVRCVQISEAFPDFPFERLTECLYSSSHT